MYKKNYTSVLKTSKMVIIFGLLLLLSSCGRSKMHKKELQKWLGKNKALNHQVEINGIVVKVRYHPSSLLILQELEAKNNRSSSNTIVAKDLEKKYSNQYYFGISFSKDNKEVIRQLGSFSRYSDMLQVFSFELASKITATTELKDTVELKDYAFEQNYGLGNQNNILIAFDKERLRRAKEIVIHIEEFGLGTGTLDFLINRNEMEAVPDLLYTDAE